MTSINKTIKVKINTSDSLFASLMNGSNTLPSPCFVKFGIVTQAMRFMHFKFERKLGGMLPIT